MENAFSRIFMEMTIGGLTKEQLINRLTAANISFNAYAETLFDHPSFSSSQVSMNAKLINVALSDLEMSNLCSFEDMVDRASNLGLSLCPLYLGVYLRLNYLNQPADSYLTTASSLPESDENYPKDSTFEISTIRCG